MPVLCVVPFTGEARIKLFSREREEQRVADSLRIVDSLRVADSLRIADSCMTARYNSAYADLVAERKRKAEEAVYYAPVVPNPDERILSSDVDNVSARTVVVDPDNPWGYRVDSLQKKVDSLNNAIHDHDERLKAMKTFPISEKKRYMAYLLQNRMKDTTAILTYCSALSELYNLKYALLVAIRDSQQANTKSFLASHIEEHKRRMGELSQFLVALTPAVPYYPVHAIPAALPEP